MYLSIEGRTHASLADLFPSSSLDMMEAGNVAGTLEIQCGFWSKR